MKKKTIRAGGKRNGKKIKQKKDSMKKSKEKLRKKRSGITIRRKKKSPIVISQPRKRRYTINVSRRKPHIRSMTYSDSSMFSSGTGMRPKYRRKAMVNEQIDDMHRGALMLQDDNKIFYKEL